MLSFDSCAKFFIWYDISFRLVLKLAAYEDSNNNDNNIEGIELEDFKDGMSMYFKF
jgi:hypothetical protein